MKVLTKEEEDQHYAAVLRGGFLGTFAGLTLGVGSSVLLHRRWRLFHELTLPFKAFYVSSTTTFGAIIYADRYSRAFEAQRNGVSQFRSRQQREDALARANLSPWQRLERCAADHRYTIVVASWVAAMGAAGWAVSRDRLLTKAQKLVQARVYAQGLTLMVLVATAALEVAETRREGEAEEAAVEEVSHSQNKGRHARPDDLWREMVEAEEQRLSAQRRRTQTTA